MRNFTSQPPWVHLRHWSGRGRPEKMTRGHDQPPRPSISNELHKTINRPTKPPQGPDSQHQGSCYGHHTMSLSAILGERFRRSPSLARSTCLDSKHVGKRLFTMETPHVTDAAAVAIPATYGSKWDWGVIEQLVGWSGLEKQ